MLDLDLPDFDFDIDFGKPEDFGETPDFSSVGAEDNPQPEDGREFDGIEEEAKVQLSELEQAFRDRREKQVELQRKQGDTEYWVAFCFQSRAQKEAFLAGIGMLSDGDKYIDGQKAAKKLGISIPAEADERIFRRARVDKKYAALTSDTNRA